MYHFIAEIYSVVSKGACIGRYIDRGMKRLEILKTFDEKALLSQWNCLCPFGQPALDYTSGLVYGHCVFSEFWIAPSGSVHDYYLDMPYSARTLPVLCLYTTTSAPGMYWST